MGGLKINVILAAKFIAPEGDTEMEEIKFFNIKTEPIL